MTILDEIFAAKKLRVEEAKQATDMEVLVETAGAVRSNAEPHAFRASVADRGQVNVIAEFKRASPSKGLINGSTNPGELARLYEKAGARAMSVLTEQDYFQGSLDDLKQARAAVSLPLLRKDFTFDEFQIYEAAAAGADAILLIVSALPVGDLRRLKSLAEDEFSMDALVEVHTAEEMRVAAEIGAKMIGVNNRNLKTFEVSLDISRELVQHAPPDAILIAESGITTSADIDVLFAIGYSGFLIGETLMRSEDPVKGLSQLTRR